MEPEEYLMELEKEELVRRITKMQELVEKAYRELENVRITTKEI